MKAFCHINSVMRFALIGMGLMWLIGQGGANLQATESRIRLAVTTSFQNSGLSDVLLPEIEADLGIKIDLIVVGTGQALRLGRAKDVDAVLVHSRLYEDEFVANGYAPYRRDVMYNDFVIVGPTADPAGIAGQGDVTAALRQIYEGKAGFISRGDESGTHSKELALWSAAGLDVHIMGDWYKDVGAGMGAALNIASATNSYILADRASWLNFGNKGDLKILFFGDSRLHNPYGFLPVAQEGTKDGARRQQLVQRIEHWLTGEKGQGRIAAFRVAGQQLFFPNAQYANAP